MTQMLYETNDDREHEADIALKFITHSKIQVAIEKTENLHPFDYEILEFGSKKQIGWLEVKRKSECWEEIYEELIPDAKVAFAHRWELPCFMLVERSGCGRIFNLSKVLSAGKGKWKTITRKDRPNEKRRVYAFPITCGKLLYMDGHDVEKDLPLEDICHIQNVLKCRT